MSESNHPKYRYAVVSGASRWGEYGSIGKAIVHVARVRQEWSAYVGSGAVEVERVQDLWRGKRYWRWRNGTWSTKTWTEPGGADLLRWESK